VDYSIQKRLECEGMVTKDANEKRVQEQNDAINAELEEWKKNGIDPGTLQINVYILDNQFRALVRNLIKNGVIDEDEYNEDYRLGILESLKTHREIVLSAVRQAGILEGIELPPGVFDARNGKVE
jgi:hypothetical protein